MRCEWDNYEWNMNEIWMGYWFLMFFVHLENKTGCQLEKITRCTLDFSGLSVCRTRNLWRRRWRVGTFIWGLYLLYIPKCISMLLFLSYPFTFEYPKSSKSVMERSNQIGCESNNNIEMGGAYIPDKFQTDIEKRATNSYYKEECGQDWSTQ